MKKISLHGKWNYRTDKEDIGFKYKWFREKFESNEFMIPGTTYEHKIGEPITIEPKLCKESVNRLREHYSYLGAMWYQKTIKIEEGFGDKEVFLKLERTMFESRVWVDDNFIGTFDSLSTAHEFRLTEFITWGKEQLITIRIDNRDNYEILEYSSAYTPQTQTIWNGIIGEVDLIIKNKVVVHKVDVFPSIKEKKITTVGNIMNYSNENYYVIVELRVKEGKKIIQEILLQPGCNKVSIAYDMPTDFKLWSEFNPYLYDLIYVVKNKTTTLDSTEVEFGMREVSTKGKNILVNGERIFLRGTLDCCIYPLTGYPPTDIDEWTRIFNIVKDYGLNHIRFHSWCPPENAFKAANRVGLYLQAEGPVWLDDYFCEVGEKKGHYDFFPMEAKRIVEAYANNPSFILFSNGNEIRGDFKLLSNIIKELKKDNRLLYTLTTNWDREVNEQDDIFIAQSFDDIGVRGQYFLNEMIESTNLNFDDAVATRDLPVISHEVGQYCVYPDVREVKKYRGNLRAINLEAIKSDLEDKNLLGDIGKFVHCSGMLTLNLYKDDIEAALRTDDLSGVQLLDLHDFPGQSTATVGILNAFWESKGLIEPKEFRQFFSPVVPLVIMDKRTYSNKENIEFHIGVSNYGKEDLFNSTVYYSLILGEHVLTKGYVENVNLLKGMLNRVPGKVSINLNSISENSQLRLEVGIENTEIKNTWTIWAYADKTIEKNNFEIVYSKDDITRIINEGKNAMILVNEKNYFKTRKNKFFPVFWSPVHFETTDPNGMYINNYSELLKEFPSDDFGNYQWKTIIENSISMEVDSVNSNIENMLQTIPNYFTNGALSILFTVRVNNSNLVVTSIDFTDLHNKSMELVALYNSIVKVMNNKIEISKELDFQKFLALFK